MLKVLIVDDSVVYRSKIKLALAGVPGLEVVGTASNGKIALDLLAQKDVDVMTLDMEMPVLNGLETLKELRARNSKVKVIVFSSQTRSGSEAALDALSAGARDFCAKPNGTEMSENAEELIRKDLVPKMRQFMIVPPMAQALAQPSVLANAVGAPTYQSPRGSGFPTPVLKVAYPRKELISFRPSAVVIASSTGGPSAHDAIFKGISGKLRCPVFIAQHMPPVFTTSFAKRIGSHAQLPSKEAKNFETVANEIYVAPGDYHMSVDLINGQVMTRLDQGPQRNSVRPAADFLFESAAKIFGPKVMGFVLTGMGEDGLDGARAIKTAGGGMMIQNQESSVVWGMPGAVHASGAFDEQGDLADIQKMFARMVFE